MDVNMSEKVLAVLINVASTWSGHSLGLPEVRGTKVSCRGWQEMGYKLLNKRTGRSELGPDL